MKTIKTITSPSQFQGYAKKAYEYGKTYQGAHNDVKPENDKRLINLLCKGLSKQGKQYNKELRAAWLWGRLETLEEYPI